MTGRVPDLHARQEAELDRLLCQRKHARDNRLRGDHRCDGCKSNKRVVRPVWRKLIERTIERARVSDQQRGLSEVVEHERRQGNRKPCKPDWHLTKVSHIGIHGFAAGHREKGSAENGEADVEILVDQKIEGIKRAHGGEHIGSSDDAVDAEQCNHKKPTEHHRPEYIADEAGAFPLHDEKPDQDDDGEWHHSRRQRRRIDLQAFNGAEHGDGRRDGAVTIKQRRTNEADDQELRAPCSGPRIPGREQRQQRNDPAFAAVVGAQNKQRIFN